MARHFSGCKAARQESRETIVIIKAIGFSPLSPLMKFRSIFPAFLLAATLLPAPNAQAQRTPRFGIDGGLFFPSSSKTKAIFGSSFKSIGPGFGQVQVSQRKFYPDFDFLREDKGDNSATVVFAGAKILIPLGAPAVSGATGFAPYSGFGVNLTYADIDAPDAGIEDKGFGAGASAILGASFGQRFFTEARYRITSSAADFNFSGAQIVVGARF